MTLSRLAVTSGGSVVQVIIGHRYTVMTYGVFQNNASLHIFIETLLLENEM